MMEKKRSLYTERKYKEEVRTEKKKGIGDISSSHTVFLVKGEDGKFQKVPTRSPTVSYRSSIPTPCLSETQKMKKMQKKSALNDIVYVDTDVKPEGCLLAGWEIASKLEFLVTDSAGQTQIDRIEAHIADFAEISKRGYRVDVLNSLCIILDFLVEDLSRNPTFRDHITLLLKNADKPILLTASSDIVTYKETVKYYLLYLGYLLIRLADDCLFDLASRALIWQLTAPNSARGDGVKAGYAIAAAAPVLYHSAARMLAVATVHRYPTFLDLAFVLACDSTDICIEMIKENIIDNIFTRFNPYYPETLPDFENKIFDRHDRNVPRGQTGIHMTTTLSLLLVLLKSLKTYLKENTKNRENIPVPNQYAQRCFIFAYRCEYHAQSRHECAALTVIAHVLLDCYGDILTFSTALMPDIISLSVLTELPPRSDWTQTVRFYGVQADAHLKKLLLYFAVKLLKVYSHDHFVFKSRCWLQGLMWLLEGNSPMFWPRLLYQELRRVALQVLFCALPLLPHDMTKDYTSKITRKMIQQIEEYNSSPYEVTDLYWCIRLLQVSTNLSPQDDLPSDTKLIDEALIDLCKTLLQQKEPPMKKSLVIMSLCVRILTVVFTSESRKENQTRLESIYTFALATLDTILALMEQHYLISDRWLISTLALIWEAIKQSQSFGVMFVESCGVYKLLDIITLGKPEVQCVCLAMLCDIALEGRGVAQLVTWRAKPCAGEVSPNMVRSGASITSLLASIFRHECLASGVKLSPNGVITNLRNPLLSDLAKESLKELEEWDRKEEDFVAAADLCGSRLSKIYCLLHLLSEDLKFKVSVADEAYKLYKNVKVSPQDEVILVLCSHYLTVKLNETWSEMMTQTSELLPEDQVVLEEFLQLNEAWAKEIKSQQERVLKKEQEKASKEEISLYSFLRRVRLHDALDAARDARCAARTADRACYTYAMIQDTVHALARASAAEAELGDKVIRTYTPPLDEVCRSVMTGQYYRVHNRYCVCELCRCNEKKENK